MRILTGLAAVGLVCVLLTGCAGFAFAPVVPPVGMVYTSIKAPLDVDADNTPIGSKKGEAGTISVLGLVAVGDASVRAAAEDGGITTITHLDYELLSVLGVFSSFKTIAYGE